MNGRAFLLLLITLSGGLTVGGCATQPTTVAEQPPDVRQLIVGKPQIRLPAARLAEVKSIALGAADSKGWTLVEDRADKVVLKRPMDPASPQAIALGANGGEEPIVEVTAYFVEEPGGVIVALTADALAKGPNQTMRRVDYTESYRADLKRSLQSLGETWAANRERVSAALAWHRSAAQSPEVPYPYGDPKAGLQGVPKDPLKAAWAEGTTLVDDLPAASAASDQAGDQPAPQSAAAGSESAPVVTPSGPSTDSARSAAATPTVSNSNLVALDQRPRTGMWAYYAEQFAITRGCALTDQGALLIEQRPDAEILDVPCRNLPAFRLRCHNGVCRSLE
ncbi:hypothetical protein Thimo_1475 [Thioflavicoccus mobilis 8321]|uniref:Lipoprotein n=1 Tax=Thioflavicoccus mobilis 8321 TaxID=765912 RepID=L0GY08_9GAMM|nr:hypothetical protein [Thioflavicoccus mobilis]AGA90265.1 hypothetical protein Thimo_1475 [Thioflavicoccus mobilis 8321]